MTTPKIGTVLNGRLAPLADGHNAGVFKLPDEVVRAADNASRLAGAARSAADDVAMFDRQVAQARPALVGVLAATGPRSTPGAELRADVARLTALKDDAAIIRLASRRASTAAVQSCVTAADAIGESLVAALAAVLDAAQPDAPSVAGIRYGDPDSVHELSADGQAAFHRLDVLAARHDLTRAAAAGLMAELAVAGMEVTRRQAAETFPIAVFIGHGVVGPDVHRGDPRYADSWRWKPSGHRVQRLVAAIADADAEGMDSERVADGERTEPEPVAI